jgi:hypothetical protein
MSMITIRAHDNFIGPEIAKKLTATQCPRSRSPYERQYKSGQSRPDNPRLIEQNQRLFSPRSALGAPTPFSLEKFPFFFEFSKLTPPKKKKTSTNK